MRLEDILLEILRDLACLIALLIILAAIITTLCPQ